MKHIEGRNWGLWPMCIGTLWALINDPAVDERIHLVLGQEGGDAFIKQVRELAMSFYD